MSDAGTPRDEAPPVRVRALGEPRRGGPRPPRSPRTRHADRLVWAALVLVAVAILVVALAAPLPDAASSGPVTGPDATATTSKLDTQADTDGSGPTAAVPSTPVPAPRSVAGVAPAAPKRSVSSSAAAT